MNRGIVRRFVILLCITLLVDCTDGRAERMAAMNQFVGQPEQTLVLRMGVLTRSYDAEGVKYLAYDEQRTDVLSPPPSLGPWWFNPMPA
jgi:hypothetical protein